MTIKKSEIVASRNEKTGQSYKHQPLFVGDVWQNAFGVKGVVTFKNNEDGTKKYFYCKTNGAEHGLPEDRAGFNDGNYVGNVCDDAVLMQEFIKNGLVVDDGDAVNEVPQTAEVPAPPAPPEIEEVVAEVAPAPVEEEKPAPKSRKRQTKKAETPASVEEIKEVEEVEEKTCKCSCSNKPVSLLEKINNVRAAWSKANVEKEGLGRAGGGSKYEYYKPQQIIDFCLKEEIKNNIFSEFDTIRNSDGITTACYYQVTSIETGETKTVSCPFEVPTKMACSQAQQVGAALTYYNRRLAMLMYKIEDNSRESVNVLEDADYTAQNAPEIPAPPVVPPAPQIAETLPPANVQAEVNSEPVSKPPVQNVATVPPIQEQPKYDNLAVENEQKSDVAEPPKVDAPKVEIPQPPKETVDNIPPAPPTTPAPPVQQTVEPPKMEQPSTPKTNKSIEDLY